MGSQKLELHKISTIFFTRECFLYESNDQNDVQQSSSYQP